LQRVENDLAWTWAKQSYSKGDDSAMMCQSLGSFIESNFLRDSPSRFFFDFSQDPPNFPRISSISFQPNITSTPFPLTFDGTLTRSCKIDVHKIIIKPHHIQIKIGSSSV
jgi:hypothetical protein